MIVIDGLTKHFGPFTAVDRIGFTVEKGEVLGFLGPNGAGKSTTMKMITGFLAPSAGSARVCGHDIVTDTLAAQRTIGYLPEGAPAYGDMTPRGFLRFIARVRRLSGADAEKAIDRAVEATELGGVLEQPIDTLSKGFRRRVGLAQSILHDPPVLIMDEPTDGLDPNQKFEVRKLIARMSAEKAIVISTHILEEVDAICTRALIIDRGRVVADGTPAALMARSRYHNAVSLTLSGQTTVQMAEKLKALNGIASIEIVPRGAETTFTLFPVSARESDVLLIDAVARLARDENWPVRALYGEPGRLDEVFRSLTRSDTTVTDGKKDAA
ncbi:ABC transporter ATP-binding protein [Parvibaculum sp.]|uniref:ABC transporter ATP-binding protein n=1 Tax=Parvibaculum sp. TaxID=2024848 RepID=UPI001D7C76B3|nr:ABC transporter ATP-binding protein [Parvibaculum sp.]MBX3489609.1 ABC transporter ATP-binding protein [Parvibaculum sp.]MCW5726433.1 ABC transporter ATP-binding protein [Parvibaculum sp.]